MRVTRNEEYGLRLVLRLADCDSQLTVRELADREGLPETTVAKVIARLRRGGVVNAERGRNGGYSLTHRADDLTLAQVVEACGSGFFDGHFCARMSPGDGECAHVSSCGLRPVWRGLTEVVGNFLSQITVADLVRGRSPNSELPTASLPLLLADQIGR